MTDPMRDDDLPLDDRAPAGSDGRMPLVWIVLLVAALGFGFWIYNMTGGGSLSITPASQPVGGQVATPPNTKAPATPPKHP